MALPRRILFLASGLDGASCRFRVLQYVPHLRRMGMHVDVADLHVPLSARWRILRTAAAYDTVCIHRTFLSPLEHRWLLRAAPDYVFDFDDAIMFRDSSHRRFESWQRRQRFRRMVAGARTVIAGNSYLAGWASRYSEHVTVIPTAIDVTESDQRRAECSREAVIGWIGTRINLMYLRAVLPALRRVARKRPDMTLKIISDGPAAGGPAVGVFSMDRSRWSLRAAKFDRLLDVHDIPTTTKRWSLADEADDLATFRVGIMPLPDDPWTRGKCAGKVLQYLAAAVPVVCSPVGANLEVVEHGRHGYFAAGEDEWVARLDELLGDAERCRQFGKAGRELVRRRYSVESNLPAFADALLGRGRG